MSKSVLTALRKATRGLVFMSEQDAPFRVVVLPGDEPPTADDIAAQLGLSGSGRTQVEEVGFARFFTDLTIVRKWHAEDDKAVIKRYHDLHGTLREWLSQLTVYKIGQIRQTIAIVGKSAEGVWFAVVTESLET